MSARHSYSGHLARIGEAEDWPQKSAGVRTKVLLRSVETCGECGERFQSLYPLKFCEDHDGLERL